MRRIVAVVILLASPLLFARPGAAAGTETFACGAEIDHDVVLGGDVGSLGAGCNENGLRITKSGITLDLNGHTIFGDREDDAPTVEAGVLVYLAKNVTVKNGTVRGFVDGVRATTNNEGSAFKRMVSADNLDAGLNVSGADTVLSKNVVVANDGRGIDLSSPRSKIDRNVVVNNGDAGIWNQVGKRSEITGNLVSVNSGNAIRLVAGDGAVVAGNAVSGNSSGLFLAGAGMTVERNTAIANGGDGIWILSPDGRVVRNRASDNANDGIEVSIEGGRVTGNVSSANSVDGIHVTSDKTLVSANRTDGNAQNGIDVDGEGVRIEDNKVRGSGQNGIELTGRGRISSNRAIGNGFSILGTNLGIDASDATVTGGGNLGRVNDASTECNPSSLCKEIDSGLPPADLGCDAEVTGSVRLTDDVGSSGAPCPLSGLRVLADDIEIDLDGHTIWGDRTNDDATNGSERGIDLEGRSGVHVFDGRVDGFERGVSAGGSKDIRVSDVEIRDAVGNGFSDFSGGRRPIVERVVTVMNGFSGVSIFAAESTIKEVISLGNAINGIGGSRAMRVSDSVTAGNEEAGISVTCCPTTGGTTVARSTSFNNDVNGLIVRNSDTTVKDSIVNNNGPTISPFEHGIVVTEDAPDTTFLRNLISSHGGSHIESGGERTVVKRNVLTGSTGVALLFNAESAVAKKNIGLSGVADGVRLTSIYAQISKNALVGYLGEGIDAGGSDQTLTQNLIAANKPDGIVVNDAFAEVDGNRALGNGYGTTSAQVDGVGLGINAQPSNSGANVAYGNDDDDGCDPASLC